MNIEIWERSFTMVVVASSAITVIEDFSKDTLGRYDTAVTTNILIIRITTSFSSTVFACTITKSFLS